jgi:hypothetical protein
MGASSMRIKKLLERLHWKDKYIAHERRKFARLVYPPEDRPVFKIKGAHLQIVDISEEGVKFLNDKHAQISEHVHGTVELLSGKSLDITGRIIWEQDDAVGVHITRIPERIIIDEVRTLLRESGPDPSDE